MSGSGLLSDMTSDLWKCPSSPKTPREEDRRFMGMSQMAELCKSKQCFPLCTSNRNDYLRGDFSGTDSHQGNVDGLASYRFFHKLL